jgi:hypothetical protein
MFDSSLTRDEMDELWNRGFLVKDFIPFSYFILTYTQLMSWFPLLGVLLFGWTSSWDIQFGFVILWCFILFIATIFLPILRVLLIPTIFYSDRGVYMAGKLWKNIDMLLWIDDKRKSSMLSNFFKTSPKYPATLLWKQKKNGDYYRVSKISEKLSMYLMAWLGLLALITLGGMNGIFAYIVSIPLLFLWKFLYQSFHPLYAFWNLWEKIQSLTPLIEQQSKRIEDNFQKEQSFNILSEGFDSLSSTFSQIVSLVIKLEKVEARANKWNLFDSEKYINSLRSDIIEPLKSLRVFLENQREKLQSSQVELKRVRLKVGWDPETSSGWQEHAELASKRTEPLLRELSENIEKLDLMISKMSY